MHLLDLDHAGLFDASPNPYLVLDRRLHIVGANRAYLAATRRALPDIVGRWAWDAFPTDAETLRQSVASFERVIATRQPDTMALLRFDIPRPEAEGGGFEERWWSIVHSPVLDERGEVALVLQHPIDVTELQGLRAALGAEAAGRVAPAHTGLLDRAASVQAQNLGLKAESAQLRALFEKAPGFMAVLRGPQHVLEFTNDAFERLVGRSRPGGRPVRETFPDLAGQGFFELLDRVYEGGERHLARSVPLRLRPAPEGPLDERFVDFVYEPLVRADGAVSGIFVQGHDVTDQVRAQEALRASESRQAFLLGLSDALRPLSDPLEIQEVAARALGRHLGADQTFHAEVVREGEVFVVGRTCGSPGGRPSAGRFPAEGFGALAEELRAGRAVVVDDIATRPATTPAEKAAVEGLGVRALVALPLIMEGGLVAVLGLHQAAPRAWSADEIALADATAQRARSAIERARAEAALTQSEERFRAIVETARDYAIFTTDAEGRIQTWPPGAAEVLGWTAAEAVGRMADMTFTPEDRAAGAPEQERLAAREAGQAPDVRWHLRRDGSRVFIEGAVRPLVGADGRPTGFLKVGQDVTERRTTSDALRESEARFRQFGEASADVLWIRDAETLAFEYLSPAFEAVYGLSREEALRGDHMMRWLELIHPDDRDLAREHIQRVRGGERMTHGLRVIRPSDGELRWIRDTVFPLLDAKGRVQRIGGIGRDVTEEVETANRLQVLVAELQHRTRNLIGVVRAVADRTLARSESLREFQTRYRARLDALARVNGLLSRLEEGDRVAFDELLRTELAAHGALEAQGRGSQVRLEGPEGVRLRSATVQTLALALHELATNALKHGALSGPEGRLEVAWTVIDGGEGQKRLRVEWTESAPPSVAQGGDEALRQGYGRELIERALPYQLGAETAYEMGPAGVRCTIVLPLSPTRETRDA